MDKKPPLATTKTDTARDVSPWALAGLGMQFFVALLASAYVGNWLDGHFHTPPVFLLLGVFVGGGGTFVLTVRRVLAASARGSATTVHPPSRHQ